MAWVAKAGLLSSRLLLLRLRGLGVRRRDGAIAVLAQLWGAREGIGGYWRSGAPVACAPRLPTVGSLHMLALLVGLRRRILEGVGRIWHCDGGGRLGDWRKYLSHRELVAGRLSRLVCLVRGRLAGAGDGSAEKQESVQGAALAAALLERETSLDGRWKGVVVNEGAGRRLMVDVAGSQ